MRLLGYMKPEHKSHPYISLYRRDTAAVTFRLSPLGSAGAVDGIVGSTLHPTQGGHLQGVCNVCFSMLKTHYLTCETVKEQ